MAIAPAGRVINAVITSAAPRLATAKTPSV